MNELYLCCICESIYPSEKIEEIYFCPGRHENRYAAYCKYCIKNATRSRK